MLYTNSQRVTFLYSFSEQDIVLSVVRKLGSFFIEDRVSSSTTHVIAGSPRRTLNVLMAIAQGCWLVSPMWVRKYRLLFFQNWSISNNILHIRPRSRLALYISVGRATMISSVDYGFDLPNYGKGFVSTILV